jgi:transposase
LVPQEGGSPVGHRITRAALHLSADEVKERMHTDTRPWVRQHWWIIYNALVAPRKAEEIALHIGTSATTVHRVVSIYNRLGPVALETPGRGGRRHQYLTLVEEKAFLFPFFAQAESGEIATVAQIQHAYETNVGHEVAESTIYRLLNRHGWRKLMPRPRHPQADPQQQERFKKDFEAQARALIATRSVEDERPVLIMAQDEGCFGRINRAKRCWAPPGMRPHVPAQVVREYTYVYAAVAPQEGLLTSLILPEASTKMMNLFLEHLSLMYSKYFIVMQVDGAGWHRSQELVIPANIHLIQHPPYSPEVNPVEHIWDELREKYFHNLVFPSLELLIDILCQGLNDLADDPKLLRSLTGFPHLNVTL